MAVKLWPTLPKDHESNGLTALERPLLDEPDGPYYFVAEVNRKRATEDDDTGETIPTIRVLHGEALFGDDAQAAVALLRKAQISRCGPPARTPATLPFGEGPGDETPGDQKDDPDGQDLAGDLEPAAGRPPFISAAADGE